MHLVIFESPAWTSFAPLTFTRPVFSLLSGTGTLLDRQIRRLNPSRITLWVRPAMEDLCRQRIVPFLKVPVQANVPLDAHPAILLNASSMTPTMPPSPLAGPYVERAAQGQVGCTFLTSEGLTHLDILSNTQRWQDLTGFTTHECRQECAGQLADLLHENERLIEADFAETQTGQSLLSPGPYHSIRWETIRCAPEAKIGPGVVLDASNGPIVIARGANIGANSVIEGPCYIGENSLIRPLSLIHGGTTIGPGCKIGGEVGESIVQGNSNKVHDGYLGHSYLGEWVNLGAGTTTSNLKNTYGQISMKIGLREIPTGRIFMGSVIGDYTKTAIGTRLMSGTYIGTSSMVACSRHAPRFVGSFQFLTDEKQETYQFHKAVEVASRVFARRKRAWSGVDESLLLYAQEIATTCESAAGSPIAV